MRSVRAGVNTAGIREIIRSLTPFHGSAMTGVRYSDNYPSLSTWGSLSDTWAVQFDVDRRDVGIDYVVFSYDTPIAWHLANGDWVRPNRKYSVTTSKHQGRCPETSEHYRGLPPYVKEGA